MPRKIKLPNGKIGSFPDDMSDADIEDVLQKQFPPESQKNLTSQATSTEKQSVSSDIVNSIAGVPASLIDFVANLPGQISESAGQISQNPLRSAGNLGAGLLEGIKGGLNIPSNLAAYAESRELGDGDLKNLSHWVAKAHIPDTGLEKLIFGENQKGDEFLRSLGSFAPYARLGGLSKGLAGLAKRGGATAAYATGQEQDPLQAALMGLAGEGAVRGVQRGTQSGKSLLSSPLNAEQLREAADVTRGTETSLGNVIQNPFLKKQFENTLPELPFSGANQAMQRTAADVATRGEHILDTLKGREEVPDIGERLHGALKSAYEEARTQKNERFKTLNEAADKEGIKTKRSNLIDTAKKKLEEIERDPHRAGLMDSKVKSTLKNIVNPEHMEQEVTSNIPEIGAAGKDILKHLLGSGKNKLQFTEAEFTKALGKNAPPKTSVPKEYSLQDTDLLAGDLGKLANDAYVKGEGALSDLYTSLKKAARQDINNEIDNADMPNLNALRDDAFKYYKKHYAPFKDKEVKKFTLQGGDPDMLMQSFLKNSKLSDRGNLLGKLTSKLSFEDKDLLAYSYFSNAIKDGQLNPSKLNTLYKNLGEKQKNALLSQGMQNRLKDYSQLVQKNARPLDIMFNPKTGYAGLSEIPWKTMLSGALAGGKLGGSFAGIPGATIGAIGGAVAPGIVAKPFVKGLTNPRMREFLIERMIKAREKEAKPHRNIAPLVQALMQVSNPQRQDTNYQG